MKTSLKRLLTGLSAISMGVAIALPSMAQNQATPNAETTPANTPQTPAPSNRDTGIPPVGGQSGENTPGTITSPENSQNSGGATTNPAGVPNNQSVPGSVAPANRPENNNLPGSSTSPTNSNERGDMMNKPAGVPNNQSVPGSVAPANRPETNNLPGSSSTTTTPVSFAGSETKTIDQIVRVSPSFELFNALLRVADSNSNGSFSAQLASGQYTVFAPTDEALAALPPATFKALVQPENRALLAQVLQNHIVKGKVSSADLASKQVQSLGGSPIMAQGGAGSLMIGNAMVVGPDIQAENGVIHAVNNVILPADLQSKVTGLAPQASAPTMQP